MTVPTPFSKDFINTLQNLDFFAGTKNDFYHVIDGKSLLVYGAHRNPPPLVSIIVMTYKRPEWLQIALDSALSQEGFTDYEVIVVDNEGIDIETKTETSQLVRSYSESQVVYYRNYPSARSYKLHTAIACSRSKWVCVLHDDDILAKDHLRIMTSALHTYPQIRFLACRARAFANENESSVIHASQEDTVDNHRFVPYIAESACAGCYPGWLGALIDRRMFIDMGGLSSGAPISTGIGDYIMTMKFMNRYGTTYVRSTHTPLYYYRISESQASALGGIHWMNACTAEFIFYKYVAKKYHPRLYFFWEYVAGIIVSKHVENLLRQPAWHKKQPLDIQAMRTIAGLPIRDLTSFRFAVEKKILYFIRGCYYYGVKWRILQSLADLFCSLLRGLHINTNSIEHWFARKITRREAF